MIQILLTLFLILLFLIGAFGLIYVFRSIIIQHKDQSSCLFIDDTNIPEYWGKIVIIGITLFAIFFLSGCAGKERIVYQTVYQDVYVPQLCQADPPERPKSEDSPVLNTLALIEYIKSLEIVLSGCIGE